MHQHTNGNTVVDPGDAGQATAEYALVILAAALIAVALMTWATGGGGITTLFQAVLDRVIGLVGG
ncbi:MAG: DUF4244 domain-containing protein [Acidimicrobiia bacterium]|nr:DUF4244 domain-containing protein [Acidimicrobiia bacterium]